MARNFIAASSQYLEIATAPVAAAPLTIACWFLPVSAAVTYDLVVIGDTVATNYFALIASNPGSLGAISGAASAGGEFSAITTTLFAANRWAHACATYTSATARAAFLDGGGKGTNATSVVPASPAEVDVGAYHAGASIYSPMNGQIAEVALWNVDLSDAEVAALAGRTGESLSGLPLRIRPANLVAYWPLQGEVVPEYSWSGDGTARNLAVVGGAVAVPHPDFLLPPRRRGVAYAPAAAAAFVAHEPYVVGQAVTRAAFY
jgi:hypothetical protein